MKLKYQYICAFIVFILGLIVLQKTYEALDSSKDSNTIKYSTQDKNYWFYIVSAAKDSIYQNMAIYNYNSTSGSIVKCYEKANDDHCLWKFISIGKYICIMNKATGLYLGNGMASRAPDTLEENSISSSLFKIPSRSSEGTFSLEDNGDLSLIVSANDNLIFGEKDDIKGTTSWHFIRYDEKDTSRYTLNWSDEFNNDGPLNEMDWNFEKGFVRNHEPQWYQKDNAICKNGNLIITTRIEEVKNNNYNPNSKNWKLNRKTAHYTSACVTTSKKHTLLYGRYEVKAKIPVSSGSWPAIWLLGNKINGNRWPAIGEIDMLEFYTHNILANVCWSNKFGKSQWNTKKYPFTSFKNEVSNWEDKYHIWRMDWTKKDIRLFLDNKLLNITPLTKTIQPLGDYCKVKQPFEHPLYLLLNIALRSSDGIDKSMFPLKMYIDYVRFYKEEKD